MTLTGCDGGRDNALLLLHHRHQLTLHLLRLLYLLQQFFLGFLQIQQPLHFLLLLLQPTHHLILPIILELSQSVLPKLVDILLALDFYQSDFVPFLHLQEHLFLILLSDVVFVLLSLLLDLPEEAVVGVAELCAFGADVAGAVAADTAEDITIASCFFVNGLVVFFKLSDK